jgi:hypothetical protein
MPGISFSREPCYSWYGRVSHIGQPSIWRRKTEIPHETPLALTEGFGQDDLKSVQWKAFVQKVGFQQDVPELKKVLSDLRKFLLLPLRAASEQDQIPNSWTAGGPWLHAESKIERI